MGRRFESYPGSLITEGLIGESRLVLFYFKGVTMSYYLYILRSQLKETYYTGSSDDPERRHFFHNNDNSQGYTRQYRPWDLAFKKKFKSKEGTITAERKVKPMGEAV